MFAVMGGFCATRPNGDKDELYESTCFEYITEDKIDVPNVTVQEIQDRSKADHTAQAIAVIHTLWFAIQAINRAAQGLVVTELELTTLGHVAMNVLIYWCWWYKPLKVMIPIGVRLKQRVEHEDPRSQEGGDAPNRMNERSEATSNQSQNKDPEDLVMHLLNVAKIDHESQKSQVQLSFRVKVGITFAYSLHNLLQMWLLVSTIISSSIICGIFGAIHCIAWNSKFPSRAESILWRISAIIVTTAPSIICLTVFIDNATGISENSDSLGEP